MWPSSTRMSSAEAWKKPIVTDLLVEVFFVFICGCVVEQDVVCVGQSKRRESWGDNPSLFMFVVLPLPVEQSMQETGTYVLQSMLPRFRTPLLL